MTHWSSRGVAVAVVLLTGSARSAIGQCVPPANSDEARLLAHYEAPIVFATADMPVILPLGGVALTGELVGVPAPSAAINQADYCYAAKQEDSHLSPVLPRLRVAIGLPAGFAVEGSYLPPITVDRAKPNLGSLALSYTRLLLAPVDGGPTVVFAARLHGTMGSVVGPITCPANALQQTQAGQPCYGTQPSSDTFYPTSGGAEATIGAATHGGLGVFAGSGYTWLAPHFRVGFTDLNGATDRTLVEVDLRRAAVFGGVSVRIIRALDAAAEVYSVPADLTTWRLAARYRLP
jgi:hypothetical protein